MSNWFDYLKNAGLRLGKKGVNSDESRSEFQRDYDRIIFFDAFRRLQNKTQVLPVPKSEEVRNRLTHSLETASVGRSLGYLTGKKILEKYPSLAAELHLRPEDFGYMVSAAALAHDIGNPPFGHEGERAVSDFFRSDEGERLLEGLTEKQKADFQNFEGNAAGFRVLTHTPAHISQIRGGLRLSLGTLGAFVKYPQEVHSNPDKSTRKYGLFQSEIPVFEEIARDLSLIDASGPERRKWHRFPLVYLTEAADDICYTLLDYEDGFYLGLIDKDRIVEKFSGLTSLNEEQQNISTRLLPFKQLIGYLRAHAINRLIQEVVEIFVDNEEDIVSGHFSHSLISMLDEDLKSVLDEILKESIAKIYHHSAVLKNEAAGKTVIPFLLEKFVSARLNPESFKQYHLLMPLAYRTGQTRYDKIMDAVMFVTSMSDRQAIEWYKNFNGIELADY